MIRLEYLSSTSLVEIREGTITTNFVGTGSVFYATEALEGNFIDVSVLILESKYFNLHILKTHFNLNNGNETSSCVTVAKRLTGYSYSWMTLKFQDV